MFSCDHCKKDYKFKSYLDRHIKTCKNTPIDNDDQELYKCDTCSLVFKNKRNLQRHIDNDSCESQKYNHYKSSNDNNNDNNYENNITGDHNTITNNITNNNIFINNPVIIRPIGYEDIKFLTDNEMDKILLSENPELNLIEKLLTKEENVNFYKDNIKEPYITFLQTIKSTKCLTEANFSKLILDNAYSLIVTLFYIRKDYFSQQTQEALSIKIFGKDSIKKIIGKPKKDHDVMALINHKNRQDEKKEKKKDIQEFTHNIKSNIYFEKHVNKIIQEINELRKDIIYDMKSINKKGLPPEPLPCEDINDNIKPDLNDPVEYEQFMNNQVELMKFRSKHNTIFNLKNHVKKIDSGIIDEQLLDNIVYAYYTKLQETEQKDTNQIQTEHKNEINDRDKTIDEELYYKKNKLKKTDLMENFYLDEDYEPKFTDSSDEEIIN